MALTIFLPIRLRATGGTSSFARKFQAAMARLGHRVIFEHQPTYDVLLVSPQCHPRYIIDAWYRHKPVVHRLDGVYYPATTVGWKYPFYNLPLRFIRNYAALAIIYQSRFSQESCQYWLGPLHRQIPQQVIYNGVNNDHFSPDGIKANVSKGDNHVFITASRFRRPDQITPLLEAFARYRTTIEPNSQLLVIGDFTAEASRYRQPMAGVRWLGIIPNADLPAYLRAADVFVFTHYNPPCPNNVIEALACGLPVCGISNGAMPEIVQSGVTGELLSIHGRRWQHHHIDPNKFAQAMARTIARQDRYGPAARAAAIKYFDVNIMAARYLDVFNALV